MIRKFVSAPEAISKIPDNAVVAISGFNAATSPFYLIDELINAYRKSGHPRNLFIISDAIPAIPGFGLDKIGKLILENPDQDFVRGFLLPFYGWAPELQKAVIKNLVEAYTWPIGIVTRWLRTVAVGAPGVFSRVGLGTFIDPRQDGGFLNDLAKERKTVTIELVEMGRREYLLYKAPKPNVGLIRATTADEIGNLSMEQEAIYGSVLSIVEAVKAHPGGVVIAQVLRTVTLGEIHPKHVVVPGPLVDYVVVTRRGTEVEKYHWQTASFDLNPIISGDEPYKVAYEPVPLTAEKVIARRVVVELVNLVKKLGRPVIVNLGIGIPALAADVIREEQLDDFIHLTVESGPWGGIALPDADFGAAMGHYAVIPLPEQFVLYEGGAIDATSLGFMQVDREGNVNPAFLPGRLPGPGGFPVIALGSPRVYFAGGFTAGKRNIRVKDCKLVVEEEPIIKFVEKVYKIVFSGRYAVEEGKEVMYITERAVFRLTPGGVELVEAAPGIDIEKDVLSKMEFKPVVRRVDEMDERLFCDKKLGLREEALEIVKR
ncbi:MULTISPECIES: acyl CoA:acetate/3-ketoacid CoA transferase [Pyrobaculum]|uniref:Propionate CoA-transferase n=2 Tax=Pyrobaculum arsenaticum TaxID=121277 RepID=A4WJA5_PYRAR|nr:CoA-transferase [Pyrobaculum arsenaticum]ABP50472.1 propionate CoA-transferase [Pyrobaculum arsenaticum DSM 13514]NYR14587.1 acyl CoA:acetate/3-ketoacid CoA transferase [Pyrobaculum arsenaticum]